jgi:hypothetical protein
MYVFGKVNEWSRNECRSALLGMQKEEKNGVPSPLLTLYFLPVLSGRQYAIQMTWSDVYTEMGVKRS